MGSSSSGSSKTPRKNSTCVSPGWACAHLCDASCSRLRRSGYSPKPARGFLVLDQGHVPGLQVLFFLVATSVHRSYTVCETPPNLLAPSDLTLLPSNTYPTGVIRYRVEKPSLTPTRPASPHRTSSDSPSNGGFQRVSSCRASEHIAYIPIGMARPMLARETLHDTAIPTPAVVQRHSGEGYTEVI